jgi:hypothetical protein
MALFTTIRPLPPSLVAICAYLRKSAAKIFSELSLRSHKEKAPSAGQGFKKTEYF